MKVVAKYKDLYCIELIYYKLYFLCNKDEISEFYHNPFFIVTIYANLKDVCDENLEVPDYVKNKLNKILKNIDKLKYAKGDKLLLKEYIESTKEK